MRGKLIDQNPNDEPANVLLDKIKAEKDQLVKEKKIKKTKSLPEIAADEKPFEIPNSWEWVRLGEILTIFNGKAFKPRDWSTKGLPIVRIQNLNNPLAEYHLYNGSIEDRYHLKGNELLFAWSGTPGTSFGAHIWKNQEAVLNQHIFKLEFDQKNLDKKFLKNVMNLRVLKLIDEAHGSAGLRHITKKMFEETTIPLPPLTEQSRIVSKLEQLFTLIG
ncbi:restriction endonuclease subunit S [Limosilactobacillus reuteri]|nr:restriction endonuclease subunit S [Limosilactobacillus reuteri]MCC4410002.1 restriction endonuclease subunit S [Limosilactobacillus reuteri]